MKKIILGAAAMVFMFAFSASIALASPVEKTAAFVCPVIESQAVGLHNPNAIPLGDTGTWTVVRGQSTHQMMVPVHATNMDGYGIPGGPQSGPGDQDYTAIWAVQ